MSDAPEEKEYKLLAGTNRQFKFQRSDDSESLLDKARMLAELLCIKFGSPSRIEILDTYYDDASLNLARQGCSVRVRLEGDRQLLTVKAKANASSSSALERPEHEVDLADSEKKGLEQSGFRGLRNEVFLSILKRDCQYDNLSPVVAVINERLQVELRTDVCAYKLCFDKYRYRAPNGDVSGVSNEIEIEAQRPSAGQSVPHDSSMGNYIAHAARLFDYVGTKTSKFQRGMDWLEKKDARVLTINVAFFDIVGYSRLSGEIQRRVVQRFSSAVSKSVQTLNLKDPRNAYIPTGDGMIIVLQGEEEKLLPLVIAVQSEVKNQGKMFPGEAYAFRTGINVGPVFTYSDINDAQNYAGGGINLAQRVMGFGDAWHVLASEAAYNYTGEMYEGQKGYFHELGFYEIKHGAQLKLFNVYSTSDGFGNPASPS